MECRHYLVITVHAHGRDRYAVCERVAVALLDACLQVPQVVAARVERNRVSGPNQADLILCTEYATSNDLVHVRAGVLRERIAKLCDEVGGLEFRELNAVA